MSNQTPFRFFLQCSHANTLYFFFVPGWSSQLESVSERRTQVVHAGNRATWVPHVRSSHHDRLRLTAYLTIESSLEPCVTCIQNSESATAMSAGTCLKYSRERRQLYPHRFRRHLFYLFFLHVEPCFKPTSVPESKQAPRTIFMRWAGFLAAPLGPWTPCIAY